jgi:hypothetical protein
VEINSGKKDFSNLKVVFFLETQDNPLYYQYIYAIARKIQNDSGSLKVLILEERLTKQSFFNFIRFLKRKKCQLSVARDLKQNFGVDVEIRPLSRSVRLRRKLVRGKINQAESAIDLLGLFPDSKYLGAALHSFFCSALSMSSDPLFQIRKYRAALQEVTLKFFDYRDVAQDVLSEAPFDLVMFTNGRTPEQAVFKECAESELVPWLCLEHGARPGETYFLENFQTQDRVNTQALIKRTYDELTIPLANQLKLEFEHWRIKQENDPKHNPTLAFRNNSESQLLKPGIFPVFTSSIDEEMSCPGWSLDNVRNLTERTINLCNKASSLGWDPVVVIHPNTLNKKWHDLSFLMTELKKHDVKVALPWDPVSSYQYLNDSELVVTWRSTIGLEAIIKSKCLLTLSDTTYDELIELRNADQLVAREYLSSCGNSDYEIFMAKFVIYFYTHFGYNLFEDLDENDLEILSHYEKILPLGSLYKSIRNKIRKFFRPLLIYSATPKEFVAFLQMFMPKRAITPLMYFLAKIYQFRN